MTDKQARSCGPQPLVDEFPTGDWCAEQLTEYATQQHEFIEAEEVSLAPRYWRLGLALNLVRKQIPHGEWKSFMKSLGIEKTRASKARAIHQTFESEADLVGMSVDAAYDARTRTRHSDRYSEPADPLETLSSYLQGLPRAIEEMATEIPWTSADSISQIVKEIKAAVSELHRLRRQLESQATQFKRQGACTN